jgi:hypothetical protein
MTSVSETSNGSRCRGRNRAGLPCQRRAVKDGYCTTHHPTEGQDMSALGRRGGSRPKMTALRRAAAEHDDSLRDLAAQTLERALRGEQVDKAQLDAARSLFSFRAAQPPYDRRDFASSQPQTIDGQPVTGLPDVILFGLQIGGLSPAVIEAARRVVAAAETPPREVSLESRSSSRTTDVA